MQKWLIVTAVGIALLAGLVAGALLSRRTAQPKQPTQPITDVAMTEQQQIDEWIKANNLNEFGDPKDTVYTGGTPLFDEQTGQTIDRYDYIIRNHPERPWRVQ